MTFKDTERFLKLLRAHGVSHFRSIQMEVSFGTNAPVFPTPSASDVSPSANAPLVKAPPSQAAPPVETSIPHHVNEVAALLKLSNEELVERMFPETPMVGE